MSASGKPSPSRPVSHHGTKNYNVLVRMTDGALFDDNIATMKTKFAQEMQRVDLQMLELGTALATYNAQKAATPADKAKTSDQSLMAWEAITNSPLVTEQGENKVLKLQFDVSQFEASEVQVSIGDDLLTIVARHEEKSDSATVNRELSRSFPLPKGINPETVESSISKDGVLMVQIVLTKPEPAKK